MDQFRKLPDDNLINYRNIERIAVNLSCRGDTKWCVDILMPSSSEFRFCDFETKDDAFSYIDQLLKQKKNLKN